jgi:hypothetical protein
VNYLDLISSSSQQLQSSPQSISQLAVLHVINDDDKVVVDNNNDNENDNNNDKSNYFGSSSTGTNNTETATDKIIETSSPLPQVAAVKSNDWAKVIWDVTSQTTPAKTPHERLIMGIIVLWTLVVSGIGFYSVITTSSNADVDTDDTSSNNSNIPQLIVGYIVNAPLSAIQTVLKTKQNNTLHVPTMITNTLCSIFWTAYAVAPQINDPFIYVPNGLGVLLGLIQFILYLIFPRSSSTPESKITAMTTEQQQQQHTDVTTTVVDV